MSARRENIRVKKQSKESKIVVDLSVYPLEAVQAVAYSLMERLSVRIERGGNKAVSVILKPKSGGNPEALADEFQGELLHETLRLQVSLANQKIREYIVTKALVSAQVPSVVPEAVSDSASSAAAESCPECQAQQAQAAPPPVDAELEKEIEKLLVEIEKGDGGDDPLGVAVPWEEKYGKASEAAPPPSDKEPSKMKSKTAKPAKPGAA